MVGTKQRREAIAPIGGATDKIALFLFILLSLAAISRDGVAASTHTILLDDSTTVSAARVDPWPQAFVRAILPDRSQRFISTSKIKSITDDTGQDRTKDVLRDRKSLGEFPPASISPERTHGFLFRPRPLPMCKSYFIYDLGISAELGDGYPGLLNDNTMVSLELGYMRNLTAKNAVGLGVIGMTGDEVSKLAIRGRYRRWLSSAVGLDGTLGMTVAGGDEYGNATHFPGGIASVGVQVEGLLGVTLEGEQVRQTTYSYDSRGGLTESASHTQWRARAVLGSGLGVVGTVFLVGLGVVYAASVSGWD